MSDEPLKPIVFPCPECKRFVTVDPADRKAVRRSKRGDLLIVQVECPVCKRPILQSILG